MFYGLMVLFILRSWQFLLNAAQTKNINIISVFSGDLLYVEISLYPVKVNFFLLSVSVPGIASSSLTENTHLATFSAMLLLPTIYFRQTGQQVTWGFFRQNSQMAWPSLHCQILKINFELTRIIFKSKLTSLVVSFPPNTPDTPALTWCLTLCPHCHWNWKLPGWSEGSSENLSSN